MIPCFSRDAGRVRIAAWNSLLVALFLLCPPDGQAGGSGLNVLIVANQASSNSLELANYYRVKRQVPPEHLLRIGWSGSNIEWTQQDFTNHLLDPILAFVNQNALSNQIQYVVLSMDIPYRISGSQANSTTAALFYGYKSGSNAVDNSYSLSEGRFLSSKPLAASTNAFLTFMLTAGNLDEAKRLVDQGVASDSTFPGQTAWLTKSSDPARNIRYRKFDNAIFNTRLSPGYFLLRTNLDSDVIWTNLMGCQLGLANFEVNPDAFVPGAIADSLTSFGGQIFENPGQTTLLEFIGAGVSGSYGTVTEPLGVTAKFPDPLVYFYQARGFTLAECYHQSVQQPFQGLFVGEPLAAPWRQTFDGGWAGVDNNAMLGGVTNLCLSFSPTRTGQQLERVDLFVNGAHAQTLTNVTPQSGNRLRVDLNGYTVEYEVPTNATLKTIASGLAAALNQTAVTNLTQVKAKAVGDRIELQSFAAPLPHGVFQFVDDEATLAEPRFYLAAPGPYSLAASVSISEWTDEGSFRIGFESAPGVSNVLQASTNLLDWETVVSNALGGAMEWVDTSAASCPQRFYRVALPSPSPTPSLRALGVDGSTGFWLQIDSPTNRPYVLQASSDFNVWSDLFTNSLGDSAQFLDLSNAGEPTRYYRTRSGDSNAYEVVSVNPAPTGENILQVTDTSPGDIVVWSSTNGTVWSPIFNYVGSPAIQTTASSDSGSGEPLTTHLRAASPVFLDSMAFGIRSFIVSDSPPADGKVPTNAFLRLEVTKTNGSVHAVALTNTVPGASFAGFMQQFVGLVNMHASLQEPDGLILEDFSDGPFTVSKGFNLRARTAGRNAAQIKAALKGTFPGFVITPSGTNALTENESDLLPRNHLYVSAGLPSITHCFELDTTALPDGYHELTAVAYEGTHVYSQTLSTLPVIVTNSTLEATLALASTNAVLPLNSTFDLVLTANTNTLQTIQLFTTGGLYAAITNQSAAVFGVNGPDLGAGEHPFHALVTTTDGLRYRTPPLVVTLTP